MQSTVTSRSSSRDEYLRYGTEDGYADALGGIGILERRRERQLAGVAESLLAEGEVLDRRPVQGVASARKNR